MAVRRDKRPQRSASRAAPRKRAPSLEELVSELQIQQAELETQNASLREVQQSLEKSRDRYAELFDFAPIAYITLDENAIIRGLNLAAATLIGMTRQNAIGYPFANYVHRDHQARFWGHMARCHHGLMQLTTELDLRIRPRVETTQQYVPVQLITAPNLGEDPEFRMAVLDLRDRQLAQVREAELVRESARREEAERTNRAKDEFLSLLAHELRTPLNAIHGWTHLLSTGRLSEEETRRAIEVIGRNVQIQVALIDEMLDLSRIVHGKIDLRKNPLDLCVVVGSVVDGMRPMAAQKQVQLDCHLDPIAARAIGDEERLGQVVLNLLGNAIKFTPPDGRVSIRLERGVWTTPTRDAGPEQWLECARLTVSDTGCGILASELPHVFDRFWRGPSISTRKSAGLGLGLAIARRLVEMHGGTIRAHSDGEDAGATFTVELPIEWGQRVPPNPRPPSTRAATNPAPERDLRDIRILLVDDDDEARDIVKRVLEPRGATVTTVATAREAYEAIQRLKPDLLLSDLAMPEEDGLSLIERIRKLPAEAGGVTPAIALTAWAGAGDEDRVLAAGFETFVAKPVDPDRLGELIGSMVSVTGRRRGGH